LKFAVIVVSEVTVGLEHDANPEANQLPLQLLFLEHHHRNPSSVV